MILPTLMIVGGLCILFGVFLHHRPTLLLVASLGTLAVASWASFASGDTGAGITLASLDVFMGWLAISICRMARVPQPYRGEDGHVAADAPDPRSDAR